MARIRLAASRRRLLRSAAAACLAAAAVVALWPAPAEAESPDSTGWWNKLKPELPPDAGNPIPPPPDVPPEGLLVTNDPTGPQAYAALRFEATRPRVATLTLHAADDEAIAPTADIVACPALGEWDQASNGAWERRPEFDCLTLAAPGQLSDDGLTMTWEINEEYFRLGVLVNRIEVVVLPNPESAVPFRAVFERPGADALVADGPLIEPPGAVEGSGGVLAPPALPTAGSLDAPAGPAGAVAEPFAEESGGGPAAASPDGDESGRDVGTPGSLETAAAIEPPGSTSDRLLAAALLALTGLGLIAASGRRSPEPKLIGGLAHRPPGDRH